MIMSIQINKRYKLVHFGFIANQRNLQSDWMTDTTGHNQSESGSFRCYIPMMTHSTQKTLKITWFFPQIFTIKKSYNMAGWKTKMVTTNQKRYMPPSLDDYLYAKNIRTHTILFRNIDDQRILQSDWSRGRIGCTPNKKMLTSAYDYLHAKRSKILIDFFETYCWSKNSAIWLAKRHNWPHLIKIGSCPFLWLSLYK